MHEEMKNYNCAIKLGDGVYFVCKTPHLFKDYVCGSLSHQHDFSSSLSCQVFIDHKSMFLSSYQHIMLMSNIQIFKSNDDCDHDTYY